MIYLLEIINILVILLAAYLAWRIGIRQNEINAKALSIQNFVEIFVMPQQILGRNEKGEDKLLFWNICIKNASSYPIYLNTFTLNKTKHVVGNSVIPTGGDNWYAVPIPQDIQKEGKFELGIEFEDYLGNQYKSQHNGVFENYSWQIRSKKREVVKMVEKNNPVNPKENQKARGLNIFPVFILLLLPIFLSVVLITPSKEIVKLDKEDFPFKLHIFNSPNSNLKDIFGEILGNPFKLNWYDVCLTNRGYIEINDEKTTPDKLVEPLGDMYIYIYPLSINHNLSEHFHFLEDKNVGWTDYGKRDLIYDIKLSAKHGENKCIVLKNEEGFLFKELQIMVTQQSSHPAMIKDNEMSVRGNDIKIEGFAGDSQVFVKTNDIVLKLKRIIFVVLFGGLVLLLWEVLKYIFPFLKNKKIKST